MNLFPSYGTITPRRTLPPRVLGVRPMWSRTARSIRFWLADRLSCHSLEQRHRRWALAASALLHGMVLLLLGCVVLAATHPEGTPLLSFWSLASPDRIDVAPAAELPKWFDSGGAHVGTSLQNATGEFAVQVSAPTALISSPSEFPSDRPSNSELLERVAAPAAGRAQSEARGEGTGVSAGNGSANQPGFFGIQPSGTRFVYVVDCSNSMNAPHAEARTRFQRLKLELVKSVGGLRDDMQFFVIFFSSETFPMPATEMQFASPQNKEHFLTWVAKARAGGGTDPANAVKYALHLRPDVIYLLTDGDFDEKFGKRLDKINKHRVAIHTFGFGDKAADKLLKHIAENNRGTYTFVP